MTINFNAEPYYDDFDQTKKFYRILFKPGYAVQARELTQLQTALQDQISKFGKHVFTEGTIVQGGERAFEKDLLSIKLDPTFSNTPINVLNFDGTEITGVSSGTKATVKIAEPSTATDPNTLIVKIVSGTAFTAGETVTCTVNTVTHSATIQTTNAFNDAMIFTIQPGIFFAKGCFVYHPEQTITIDKYSNTSSKNIGFVATEYTISSEEDADLLDNAQGTFNYDAPGADRYSIDLVLTIKELNQTINEFIEIARVVNGELVSNIAKTVYSEIGKELARRTYDESGNYSVKSWRAQVLDHQPNPNETYSADKFTIAFDPGKAYVKGYEFETINQEYITLDRARDIGTVTGGNVNTNFGNFVYVNTVSGLFTTNSTTAANAYVSVNLKNSGGTVIGTARVRYIQRHTGTPGLTSCVFKMFLFNITMGNGYYFKNVNTIVTAAGATATIDTLSKVGSEAVLSGSDAPQLVYPVGSSYVQNIGKGDYATQMIFSVAFSSGTKSIVLDADQAWVGTGALSAEVRRTNFLIVKSDGTIVDPTSVTIVNTANVNHQADIVISGYTTPAGQYDKVIATVLLSNQLATKRQKTLTYSKVILGTGAAGGLNTTANGKDSLKISDVYELVGVYNTATTNPTAVTIDSNTGVINWNGVTHTDATTNYTLDNGQRAELYDHGNIVLSGTAPTSSHYLVAFVRTFIHSGTGYLTKNSYSVLDYEDIPTFTDPSTGKTYNLRDCLDFRPIKAAGSGSTTLEYGQIPDPLSSTGVELDTYSYYYGRMDKIIAMPDKTFQVKKGVPAILPVVPTDNTDGMTVCVAVIPPYTGTLADVGIKYIDNKRYTMRDIGKLDKRIQTLEYYTQLSLLEKQAKDTSIPDSSNFEKFKNGFAVDPFTSADIFSSNSNNWSQRKWSWWTTWFNGSNSWNSYGAMNYNTNSIAEASHYDFNAAIDPINQELRAPFTVNFVQFNSPTLSSTSKAGELVTLNYTESSVISQMSATGTMNVNPFNIIMFNGSLVLEPSFDQWVDTNYLPAINNIVDVSVPDAAEVTNRIARGGGRIWATEKTTSVVNTNVLSSSTTSLGASVVDVQFVPFIRANTVVGIASGLKPLATVIPFIENEDVTTHSRPLTLITVQNHSGPLFNTETGSHETLTFTGGVTAKAVYYSSPTITDSTKRRLAVMGESGAIVIGSTVTGANGGTATVTAVQTYVLDSALTPDEYGFLAFEVQIPAGTFKTGERTVRLIDDPTNDILHSSSTAEAKYTANGIIQTKQDNILTTRTIQRQKVTTVEGYWYDPLAQTFNIDSRAYPQGMHVSSVDVYFKTKSTSVPVKMQIRRTVNGYPESWAAIPFAEVELMPEHVNVSTDASVATTFTFPNPIYLSPADYAITLISQCQDYEVFIAEMGRTEVNGTKIVDKQPYNGSLFKSQNAATWTAVENMDLKFNINRAVFGTSGTATFEIKDPASIIEYQTLYANSSSITPAGTSVDWEVATWSSGATEASPFVPVNINQDIDFTALKKIQAKAGLGGASLILRATLSTENDTVSPTVDASALSVVAVKNQINDDITNETNPIGGHAIAKYITKPINLASGFDASNICVTIDVNKPAGTNVHVYYKTLPSEKVTPIIDENWVEMTLETSVPSSATALEYREHRFFPPGAFTAGVYTPANVPIAQRFNTMQIKIVLTSSTPVNTPKVRDLRIIALDS